MSTYIFFGSFSFGLIYAQVCNNETFLHLYHGIYRPHAEHRRRVRECLKNGGALDLNHYKLYFVDAFFSPYIMIHNFLFKYNSDLKLYKQQMIYDLIEKFEFVNETIENFDEIEVIVRDKLSTPSKNSYSNMSTKQNLNDFYTKEKILKDKLAMLKMLSEKDSNTSEFEKDVYSNPVIDYSNVSPEEKFNAYVYSLHQKKMFNDLMQEELNRFHNEDVEELKEKILKSEQSGIDLPKTSVFEDDETRRKRLNHEKKMKQILESQDPKAIDEIKTIYGKDGAK
jgi:hypothetical protein